MCFHFNNNVLGPILVNPTMKEMEKWVVYGFLEGGNAVYATNL
jgi:hypothetical protein